MSAEAMNKERLHERAVEITKRQAAAINRKRGYLGNIYGNTCPKCKNKGYYAVVSALDDEAIVVRECACMRQSSGYAENKIYTIQKDFRRHPERWKKEPEQLNGIEIVDENNPFADD